MRELLDEIDKFIRFIAYDKDAYFAGELITDELREYLVETFEMTKKSLYLILHKKRYETKKYCINQNDMFYKINQILYYLDTYNNLYLDEDYLNDKARKSLKSNLEKILQAVNGEEIYNFINKGPEKGKTIPAELKTIKNKIILLEKLYGVNNKLTDSNEFKKFNSEVISLRNSIVHFSHSNFTTVYEDAISKSASNGAHLLRNTILHFVKKLQIEPYDFFKQIEYKSIK